MLAKSGHLTNGWNFFILNELRRLNENIEAVLEHTGEVETHCGQTGERLGVPPSATVAEGMRSHALTAKPQGCAPQPVCSIGFAV